MISGFRQVIAKEGAGALLTGLGPTIAGYSIQGALKFGGYEFWKKVAIDTVGIDSARENRTAIYLGASAIAEFFADIALCPLEATRIRMVSQPSFANGLLPGFARIAREEGVAGFYAGSVRGPKPHVPSSHTKLTRTFYLQIRTHPFQAGPLHHGQVRRLRGRPGEDHRR